jgi:hypothetical protein
MEDSAAQTADADLSVALKGEDATLAAYEPRRMPTEPGRVYAALVPMLDAVVLVSGWMQSAQWILASLCVVANTTIEMAVAADNAQRFHHRNADDAKIAVHFCTQRVLFGKVFQARMGHVLCALQRILFWWFDRKAHPMDWDLVHLDMQTLCARLEFACPLKPLAEDERIPPWAPLQRAFVGDVRRFGHTTPLESACLAVELLHAASQALLSRGLRPGEKDHECHLLSLYRTWYNKPSADAWDWVGIRAAQNRVSAIGMPWWG